MVQQGVAARARYSTKASKRKTATGGGEDVAYPAGRATVQVGAALAAAAALRMRLHERDG